MFLRSFFLLYEISFCLETFWIDFELLKEEGGKERASNMVNEPVNTGDPEQQFRSHLLRYAGLQFITIIASSSSWQRLSPFLCVYKKKKKLVLSHFVNADYQTALSSLCLKCRSPEKGSQLECFSFWCASLHVSWQSPCVRSSHLISYTGPGQFRSCVISLRKPQEH